MTRAFADHFSAVAATYASYRPTYPEALFALLAEVAPGRSRVWDCACGNGQASVGLAPYFDEVIATDASAEQIAAAAPHERVHYAVAPAEASGLGDASVDLITVAQALHWFNFTDYFAEARRVLRPGGIFACWSYDLLSVGAADLDRILRKFYLERVGPFWPPQRRHVENGYSEIPFPFEAIAHPGFAMTATWSLQALLGYCRSWSAVKNFRKAHETDPVEELDEHLRPLWGGESRSISWPLLVRIGRNVRATGS
jgi:ubiquinone/menaquinone biosynthesis C-methylase UbiE